MDPHTNGHISKAPFQKHFLDEKFNFEFNFNNFYFYDIKLDI